MIDLTADWARDRTSRSLQHHPHTKIKKLAIVKRAAKLGFERKPRSYSSTLFDRSPLIEKPGNNRTPTARLCETDGAINGTKSNSRKEALDEYKSKVEMSPAAMPSSPTFSEAYSLESEAGSDDDQSSSIVKAKRSSHAISVS
ncbi:hypothetical protein PV08_11030 [Exophiala spinifera]|uniref:Uncharacterized protein n=1 Tax=Exophiala spinifera TaxID=91928 RepID=A0A0D2AYD3_9EURO|nr:uncharacterized protein PV08_11030 [Exophiala spinifera]KIW11728.1 hypothetical protein PV08_11030 [Exophiala spinifera]